VTPPAQGGHPGGGRLSRAVARFLIRMRWFVIGFWALACLGSLFVLPTLSESQGGNDLNGLLPDDTPAIATEQRSLEIFGFPLLGRTVVVQRDAAGLSRRAQARTLISAVAVNSQRYQDNGLRGALPITNALGLFPASRESDTTALTYLLFEQGVSFGRQNGAALRYTSRFFEPRDGVVGVTGSVPARAAQGGIIRDSLPLAETLTLTAIVLIVGIAFRSVVAPAVAVLTTGVAYVMTLRLSGAVTEVAGVSSPTELEPVIVALLLGVVTDYVVFYLAALRHELRRGADRLEAAEAATARYGPIVAVAGLAVAAGAGALLVAESVFFRALGPALVFTVLMGLLVAVTLVPAIMAVLGRFAFWPTRPAPSERAVAEERPTRRVRALTALSRSRRLAAMVVAGVVVGLGAMALPLTGLNLGVSFVGSLPADNGVREAAAAARAGFADGILSPTTVLVEDEGIADRTASLDQFGRLLEEQPGVAGVLGPGDVPRRLDRGVLLADSGVAARYLVVLDDPALGAAAVDSIGGLPEQLPDLLESSGLGGARAGLAGDTAAAAYIVAQTEDDLLRIAIAALGANLLMLVLFLRALVAAVYLLVGSVLSLGAALGLTQLLFGELDPGAGLTFYVPFSAAVLLLAFGSDYNIFTVGNIWDAARTRSLPEAIVHAMPGTVSAILTAGLALAASFGLLSVVPLVPFRQLAFVMAVGIMLDVLVVRALLLPAMLVLVGPISAWPSKRLRHGDPPPEPADDVHDAGDPEGSAPAPT
jgi:RND superfamily putative drug exporter